MAVIEDNEIVSLIVEGLSVTPQIFPKHHEEQLISDALSGRIAASLTSASTQILGKAASKYQSLILETAIDKLMKCQVICIPVSICNARTKISKGIPYIFIFDGLLDLAIANIAMSYAAQELPQKLDDSFPSAEFPDVSTKAWTTVIFTAFIQRFLIHGDPLPDFRTLKHLSKIYQVF